MAFGIEFNTSTMWANLLPRQLTASGRHLCRAWRDLSPAFGDASETGLHWAQYFGTSGKHPVEKMIHPHMHQIKLCKQSYGMCEMANRLL